jgi:hypothetical protein
MRRPASRGSRSVLNATLRVPRITLRIECDAPRRADHAPTRLLRRHSWTKKRVHSFLLSSAARDPGARVGFFVLTSAARAADDGGPFRQTSRIADHPDSAADCRRRRTEPGRVDHPGAVLPLREPAAGVAARDARPGPALRQDPLHPARRDARPSPYHDGAAVARPAAVPPPLRPLTRHSTHDPGTPPTLCRG